MILVSVTDIHRKFELLGQRKSKPNHNQWVISVSSSDVAALIKDSVGILDLVGQVVPLRRAGNHHKGLCPFHQEKTPSFTVHPDKGFYHCFGCGAGGDVINFTMRHWNLSFGEAVEYLAERYHISLPERSGRGTGPKPEFQELRKVVSAAEDFFYRQLHHSAEGEAARRYAASRSLPDELQQAQRLGFAPPGWDPLRQHLQRSGFQTDLGVQAGLLVRSQKGRIYDRFRNRLMFPIQDTQGRVVAFGGRSLDGSEPKYLNSPETSIYHKGRMLYGYVTARQACRTQRRVVVVEGYMDLLAFHARQFYRVAASLGTALTIQQVRLLRRIADQVLLVYDADEAGKRAMFRALPLFFQEQLAVACIRLPAGKDPDDFLKEQGIEAFSRLAEQRQDLGRYAVIDKLDSWDGSVADKSRVIKELTPLFHEIRQPVLYSEYLQLAADRLSVSETVIQRQLQPHGQHQRPPGRHQRRQGMTPDLRSCHVTPPEESVVKILIQQPSLVAEVELTELLAYFEASPLRSIVQTLAEHRLDADTGRHLYDFLPDEETKRLFTRLSLEPDTTADPQTARIMLQDRIGTLHERQTKRRRQHLQNALSKAEKLGDLTRIKELIKELQALHAARNAADVDRTPDDFQGDKSP